MSKLSSKSKFALLLLGTLALLAVGSALFTTVGVERALSEKMKESGRNSVYLSSIVVMDKYRSLLRLKLEHAAQVKTTLDQFARILGVMDDKKDAFLAKLERLPLPAGMTAWMVDDSFRGRSFGGAMPAGFNPYLESDVRGWAVGENMLRLSRMNAPATASVYAEFPDGDGHIYFGTHFYLPKLDSMIGLWTDLQPAHAVQDKRFADALAAMREQFQSIRIGPSGFLIVTDAQGKMVIPPQTQNGVDDDDLASANPATGNRLMDDIEAASADPETPFKARLGTAGGVRDALVYSRYCRPFKWYVSGICFVDEIAAPGRGLSLYLALGMAAAAVLLALAALALLNRMLAPLSRLTGFAERLPETDFFRERNPDELAEVENLAKSRKNDEFGSLANALLFMDGALRNRVRELVETAGTRERLAGELQAAAEIQSEILPRALPENASRDRFQLAAHLTPAREVGGDLYDHFFLNDGRLCLVVGDVSGKGVPAALFMSMAAVLIRSAAAAGTGPEEVMEKVNDRLSCDNTSCMFVTLFIAFLDPRTGELDYANGGHNPPYVFSGGGIRQLDKLSGAVVGGFEREKYLRFSERLAHGETLLMYTDGVTEAMNDSEELFGEDSLRKVLAETDSAATPRQIIDAILNAVQKHVDGATASDDLTLLCLKLL